MCDEAIPRIQGKDFVEDIEWLLSTLIAALVFDFCADGCGFFGTLSVRKAAIPSADSTRLDLRTPMDESVNYKTTVRKFLTRAPYGKNAVITFTGKDNEGVIFRHNTRKARRRKLPRNLEI